MTKLAGIFMCLGLCMAGGRAEAQPSGGDTVGMAQGEASINVRSDVKLGIKGTAGTTTDRLAKLGEAVSAQMPDIRGCYRKQSAKHPELVGALRVEISLQDKDVKVAVTAVEGGSSQLSDCVAGAIEKAAWKGVGRPAAAVLSLEFDNTRARGQAMMNERASETARVEVRVAVDGKQEASWATDGGQVTFTVRADSKAARESLELAIRGFQAGYAGFLDCRRHSEKGGASPEGDITAQLVVDRQGESNVKVGKITVASERTPRCAERAFRKLSFDKPASVLRAEVLVHFAP